MTSWVTTLAELTEASTPAVLVTVLDVKGSTPREAGAKMIVTAADLHGTIGGGHLELRSIELARALLAEHAGAGSEPGPVVHRFPLGPSLGQCCGGEATLLFEPVLPSPFRIGLFGAGHIGKALCKLLADLPCRVDWIDPRADAFPAPLPAHVTTDTSEVPEDEVARLPAGCHVLVMTHSHALDLRIVEAALRRRDFAFVGLIGSETKRARFVRRLALRGLTQEEIGRLTCPIGLPGISGKQPAEIAIAVAAQLLELRSARARCASTSSSSMEPARVRGGAG